MNHNELEQFIAKMFAGLPRKQIPAGAKEQVWLAVAEHLRQTRLLHAPERPAFSSRFFAWRWVAFATLALIVAIGLVGSTKKAETSIPGEALYPVKKVAETVEKVLAASDEQKVKVGIKHAKRRLQEVKILVAEKKDTEVVADTLEALKTATEQVLDVAAAAKPELLSSAVNLVAEQETELKVVEEKADEKVKQAVQAVLTTTHDSVSRLKEGADKVQGEVLTKPEEQAAPSAASKPGGKNFVKRPPRGKDGVIESPIQLHGVTPLREQTPESPEEPKILKEPTVGF